MDYVLSVLDMLIKVYDYLKRVMKEFEGSGWGVTI